jgi:hypothetical protein
MRLLPIILLSFSIGCASLTSPQGTVTLTGSGSRGCVGEFSHIDADGSIHGNCVQAESKMTDILLGLAAAGAMFGL